jgi:hypothetical protein
MVSEQVELIRRLPQNQADSRGYRQSNHDWQFIFLGPQSARHYARMLGIPEDHIISFDADSSGITRILDRLGTSLEAYRHGDPNFVLRLQSGE